MSSKATKGPASEANPAVGTNPGIGAGTGPVERVLTGLGVSPGIAIGPAHVFDAAIPAVDERTIDSGEVTAEIERLDDAVGRALKQLSKLRSKLTGLPETAAEELNVLMDAHRLMLADSRLVRGARQRISERRINAEASVQSVLGDLLEAFQGVDDPYLSSRAADIREVAGRVLRSLTQTPYHALSGVAKGAIVIAEELTPADTALLNPDRVAGFGTVLGGAEGHTAILARALGMSAVLGVAGLLGGGPGLSPGVRHGETVIIDGEKGQVILSPTADTLDRYHKRQRALLERRRQLEALRKLPSITTDGHKVTLSVNIELPQEMPKALEAGAEGVGLLRTEFLFMNRSDLPSEDEQYAALRDMVVAMDGRPVTIRTLDIGGEKLADALADRLGAAANPALGLRAIRLSLREPELLDTQLSAILRAGVHGPIRILLPLVTTVGEIRQFREQLAKVVSRLRRRQVPIVDPLPPIGAMIEVPGAALTADALALATDFLAIGTNDLTMYTLATDRGDEQVAELYNPLHPAVLRLIQFTVEAALRARRPVSICGEIAGDPLFTPLLVGLGVRDLSMASHRLPLVKQRVRQLDSLAAARRAGSVMDQSDSGRIAALLHDFNDAMG